MKMSEIFLDWYELSIVMPYGLLFEQEIIEQIVERLVFSIHQNTYRYKVKDTQYVKDGISIFGNKQVIRIAITGSGWKSSELQGNIIQAENLKNKVKKIIKELFKEIYQVPIIPKYSVMRLDLSKNWYVGHHDIKAHDFYHHSANLLKFYEINGRQTGMTIGKSGRKKVQLKIYDKRLEPNRIHDIRRFGTDKFYRIEYQFGREYIKETGIEDSITKKLMQSLWKRGYANKRLILYKNEVKVAKEPRIMMRQEYSSEKMIVSMLARMIGKEEKLDRIQRTLDEVKKLQDEKIFIDKDGIKYIFNTQNERK